eukprot:SAG11_NODE_31322_length_292_cov_30.704663_1_plen_79_part_10
MAQGMSPGCGGGWCNTAPVAHTAHLSANNTLSAHSALSALSAHRVGNRTDGSNRTACAYSRYGAAADIGAQKTRCCTLE